jgi:hypothetical protein
MGIGISLSSCKKDDVGNTATVKIAGEWSVTMDAVDANGAVVYDDFFGIGYFNVLTYNTEKNIPTEMWVDDDGNSWGFKAVVNLDYEAATFSTKDFVQNYGTDSDDNPDAQVKIINGKVLYGAAKTPSGMPADSIIFYVSFNDDTYPADYGFENYKISGYRYTGFANDDQ